MPDPRNPRTAPSKVHQFARDPAAGDIDHRYPPIADPRSAASAGVPELVVTVQNRDHLAVESGNAAAYIERHNDWSESIRVHGVMEPIWVAVTHYLHADGTPGGVALTTADGSSRLTAVHKVVRDVLFSRDDNIKAAIRKAITVQSTRRQSSGKLMRELSAVLLLRGVVVENPRVAEQKRKHLIHAIPSAVERRGAGVEWKATGRTHTALAEAALAEVIAAAAGRRDEPGPASVELAVRAVLPLVAGDALAGVRGFDRTGGSDERQPAAVIDAMRHSRRGVRQLGTVLEEYAAGAVAFSAVDEHGRTKTGDGTGMVLTLDDAYLRDEFPDVNKVKPGGSGDHPRDVFGRAVEAFQAAVDALDAARVKVKSCRENGQPMAARIGVKYRACERMLDILHAVSGDVAVWKQADIHYNGRADAEVADEGEFAETDEADSLT